MRRVLMTLECRNSPVALYPRDGFGRPWGWFGDTCPHGRTGGAGSTGVRRRARRGRGRARPGLRRGAAVAGGARVARAARLRRGGPRRARCAARGPADQGPASGGRPAPAQAPLRARDRRPLRARPRGQQPRGGLRRGAPHAGARLGPGRLSRHGDRAPDADPARAQAPAGRAPSAHDRLHTRAAWRHAHRRLRRGPAGGPQGLRRAGYVTSPETSGNAGEIRLLALGLALLDLALELLHDVGVAQRRDVAELAALGDVAQQAAHDLARACLGQVVGPDDALRPRELADPLGHMLADVADQLLGAVEVALQGHERRDRLAGVLVGLADARRLGHMLVADDRGLDLGRGHAVAGDVDHIVDAPDDPEVAVLVPAGRVADEVDVLAVLGPVRLDVALVVPVERAQHPGPRPAQSQVALLGAGVVGLLVDDLRLDARQRRAGRPRLHVLQPGQRGDEDRARLGLPPGVDNWAALAADHVVVPEPGLRVDRLSDRAEEAQAGEVVLLRMLDAPLHARADRRRGRVEDRDLVALDQVPPDVLVRVVRRALVHHRRAAVGQRPIDDVGVPGDPADVGRAPEDVGSRLEVEHHTVRVGDVRQVAPGGVQDPLRLGGRARRVEDVERVLGVQRLGRAFLVGRLHDLVVPDVAAVLHRRVVVGVADDDDLLERVELVHLLVDGLLDRGGLALATGAVDRHERLGLGDLHTLAHRRRGEAAEHDVVRRADAGAGEHRDDDLRDHRQEDADDVALLDALVLQRVGEALDVAVQVRVGDVALLALLATPVERHAIAVAGLDVAVDAVVGDVELAADEPLEERRVGLVEDRVPLLGPLERVGLLGPEALEVLGLLEDVRRADLRALAELVGRIEPLLLEERLESLLERLLFGRHAVSSLSPALEPDGLSRQRPDGQHRP